VLAYPGAALLPDLTVPMRTPWTPSGRGPPTPLLGFFNLANTNGADVSDWSEEFEWNLEGNDYLLLADERNFYKVEKWTKDGTKIDRLLYAGDSLEKARALFGEAIKHRPRIRLTIRQRTHLLDQWPKE
jgi:hypothetical protein